MHITREVAHTPGPWRTEDEYWSGERKAKTGNVSIRSADGHWLVKLQDGPDARLIAAAPELLTALELAEATILRLKQRYSLGSVDGTLDVARAAIAKAEGRD